MSASPKPDEGCELCRTDGGEVLWQDEFLRVVLVDEPGFPGFSRVILADHFAEMTDLDGGQRQRLLEAVWHVERAMRATLAPAKINLASLGNQVPHLHWHIIPRWRDDSHFPASVWAAPRPSASGPGAGALAALGALVRYRAAIRAAFATDRGR
ncbi:MAG: HIT family protein [Burkholderiaceae bacterium]|nr:HIT family protein [Burkholderiaceae bacterium]